MKNLLVALSFIALVAISVGCTQKTCPTYAKKSVTEKHK